MSRVALDKAPFLKLALVMILAISALTFSPYSGGHGFQHAQAQTSGDENGLEESNLQITKSDVQGTYEYEAGTSKIIFPAGWSGFEVSKDNGSTVVVSVSPDKIVTLEDLTKADPVMNLVVSRKISVDMAPGTMPPLPLSMSGGTTLECEITSSNFILLNGVFSEELFSNCASVNTSGNGGGNNANATEAEALAIHSILTQTNDRWFALVFYGTPEILEENETQFNSALRTFEVRGASDLPIPFGFVSFHTFNVNANETTVPVDIKSSSNITEFALDEENKMVSFRAGVSNGQGISEFTIGRVLEGPYVVTVNGEIWSDFDILDEDSPRESRIQIRYEQEGGPVVITGTQVVPEFAFGAMLSATGPVSSMILLIGTFGVLMVLSRLRANRMGRTEHKYQDTGS